jgi:hypothetical protein
MLSPPFAQSPTLASCSLSLSRLASSHQPGLGLPITISGDPTHTCTSPTTSSAASSPSLSSTPLFLCFQLVWICRTFCCFCPLLIFFTCHFLSPPLYRELCKAGTVPTSFHHDITAQGQQGLTLWVLFWGKCCTIELHPCPGLPLRKSSVKLCRMSE